jgi:hypothetical protein
MKPPVAAGLAIAAAMFATAAIGYGGGDGDLWWQRQLGETVLRTHALPATLGSATFSAPRATWVPHEWLFATLWALAGRAGADAVFRAGCAAVALLTLVAQALRSRNAAGSARMVMLVLVALALTPSFGLRAQVLGWPLLAFIMLALEAGPRRAWFAVPLTVVWFNLHASALVVPCIVGVYGIGRAIEARRAAAFVPYAALAATCAAASLATPFGVALPRFALAWSMNPATALIYEWLPAAPDKVLILAGVFAIATLLVVGELRGAKLDASQRLLAIGLFVATLLHIRNLGLFCVVTGPWVAAALSAIVPREAARARTWRADGGPTLLACAAAVALVLVRTRLPIAPDPAGPAVAQVAALRRPVRVACEDFSWCSRFAADPNVRVLLDGRTDAYPKAVFDDYRRMLKGDPLPIFDRWHVDAALVHAKGPLARALHAAGWTALRGGESQVYLRPVGVAGEAVELERLGGVFPG